MSILRIIETTRQSWGIPASQAGAHAVPGVLRSVGAECKPGQIKGQRDAGVHCSVRVGTEPGRGAGRGAEAMHQSGPPIGSPRPAFRAGNSSPAKTLVAAAMKSEPLGVLEVCNG